MDMESDFKYKATMVGCVLPVAPFHQGTGNARTKK
jgi:hypothetical protein